MFVMNGENPGEGCSILDDKLMGRLESAFAGVIMLIALQMPNKTLVAGSSTSSSAPLLSVVQSDSMAAI
ncbi:hypothetical protein [Methylomonas koyamae]|uniref:hypothetical protein n=1 Tax=Methylomonas koyamae TaxID=702114 RepID=UPI002873137E|nr:hypothetical protein [Methylomonas koyamae]WNB78072.1 hypothetical protein RI210_10915 [Methylomonas koyamae]